MHTLILPDNYKIEILRTLKDLDKDIRKYIYDLINFDIIKEDFIINEILDLIHKDILTELYEDY